MHFHSRLLVGLTTVLACAAITVPAHAAERPRPKPVQTATITVDVERDLAQLQRQLDSEIESASIREIKREAQLLGRRKYHCNWARCWWNQRIGVGYFTVVKFTWTGTWYLKNRLDKVDTAAGAASIICAFLPGGSRVCAAMTWALATYIKAMVNRAIKHRRCFVYVYKIAGVGPPFFLRTAKCSR